MHYSRYARVFDRHSMHFSSSSTENLRFLKECQEKCNDQLYTDGYLFLEYVYCLLDLPKSPYIDGIGWWLNAFDENQNYVDFGIYDRTKPTSRNFINGLQPEIILDFNVDGNLSDYLIDLGLHLGGPDLAREFFEDDSRYRKFLLEEGYGNLW